MEITTGTSYRDQIITLLVSQKLPASDLPESLDNFIVAIDNDELIGAAGLEIYGACGLLRSVVVKPENRNQGIAGLLIAQIELMATNQGLNQLFLLTDTAPGYFSKKGYNKIDRNAIAPEVQQSSEFSHVCPQSAIAMQKTINQGD